MRLKAKLNVQFIINLMADLLGHSKEKGHAGKIFQFSCSEVIFLRSLIYSPNLRRTWRWVDRKYGDDRLHKITQSQHCSVVGGHVNIWGYWDTPRLSEVEVKKCCKHTTWWPELTPPHPTRASRRLKAMVKCEWASCHTNPASPWVWLTRNTFAICSKVPLCRRDQPTNTEPAEMHDRK